jgi:hypothetical protein
MKDYPKVCWSCGAEAMRDEGSYYVCQECGATFNPVLILAPKEFTLEPDTAAGGMKYAPTKSLVKRIKKRREGKKDATNVQYW